MRRFLEKLRSRSPAARTTIAVAGTAVLMLPVLLVWGVSATGRYFDDIRGVGDSVRQAEGSAGGLGAAIQNFTGDAWSFMSNALTKPYDAPQQEADAVGEGEEAAGQQEIPFGAATSSEGTMEDGVATGN